MVVPDAARAREGGALSRPERTPISVINTFRGQRVMAILCDSQIRELIGIEPFEDNLKRPGKISFPETFPGQIQAREIGVKKSSRR